MTTTRISGRAYLIAWLALLALTVLSFAASRFSLGYAAGATVALAIATVKATWVALVFMHLLEARFAQRAAIATAIAFVIILCLLMITDVGSRQTFPPIALPLQ
jgi:cytochrome c oxidase subunit IV